MNNCLSVLLLIVFSLLLFSDWAVSQPVRLRESGLNSEFPHHDDLPFADYLEITRRMIERGRVDLKDYDQQAVIMANSPFELLPDEAVFSKNASGKYAKGILLFHGLSDSPYHLRDIGRHLQDRGFLVRALLLPGNGTVPGDLTKINYQEWIKAVNYGVHRTKPLVEKLYIGGFSVGGALGVHHALTSDDVDGLLLFSPALADNAKLAWLTVYLRHVKTWLRVEEDRDFAKYESFSLNAAAQFYKLFKEIDRLVGRQGKRLRIPVFMALSYDDFTIDSKHTMFFFDNYVLNSQSRLLLYANDDFEIPAAKPRYIVNKSSAANKGGKVLSFAHTSITIPPTDHHYGRNGTYRNCLHYRSGSKERRACLEGSSNLLGERTEANLKQGIVQRLTYNPLYSRMISLMDEFLKEN